MLEDKVFEGVDYRTTRFEVGEYESCRFVNCVFANGDLSETKFLECTFENCDLSMVHVAKTSCQEVVFKNCKMLGLRFDMCNNLLLSFSFTN